MSAGRATGLCHGSRRDLTGWVPQTWADRLLVATLAAFPAATVFHGLEQAGLVDACWQTKYRRSRTRPKLASVASKKLEERLHNHNLSSTNHPTISGLVETL